MNLMCTKTKVPTASRCWDLCFWKFWQLIYFQRNCDHKEPAPFEIIAICYAGLKSDLVCTTIMQFIHFCGSKLLLAFQVDEIAVRIIGV